MDLPSGDMSLCSQGRTHDVNGLAFAIAIWQSGLCWRPHWTDWISHWSRAGESVGKQEEIPSSKSCPTTDAGAGPSRGPGCHPPDIAPWSPQRADPDRKEGEPSVQKNATFDSNDVYEKQQHLHPSNVFWRERTPSCSGLLLHAIGWEWFPKWIY